MELNLKTGSCKRTIENHYHRMRAHHMDELKIALSEWSGVSLTQNHNVVYCCPLYSNVYGQYMLSLNKDQKRHIICK